MRPAVSRQVLAFIARRDLLRRDELDAITTFTDRVKHDQDCCARKPARVETEGFAPFNDSLTSGFRLFSREERNGLLTTAPFEIPHECPTDTAYVAAHNYLTDNVHPRPFRGSRRWGSRVQVVEIQVISPAGRITLLAACDADRGQAYSNPRILGVRLPELVPRAGRGWHAASTPPFRHSCHANAEPRTFADRQVSPERRPKQSLDTA